ncbi:MAG TPA: hypothetical protein VD866_13700 [Urbifossiella sp.]|nr:hypothetical protein [Urbifossiella sp.]
MSMAALLRANEAALRTFLTDPTGKLAGIQPAPGRPPAKFGQWFYALHNGGISGDPATNTLANDKLFAIQIALTARKANVPGDRRGAALVSEQDVFDRAEAVADFLHMNYEAMNAANALITGTAEYAAMHGGDVTTNGFVEPLVFRDIQPVGEAPDGWFGGSNETPDVFLTTITLGEARRVRPL